MEKLNKIKYLSISLLLILVSLYLPLGCNTSNTNEESKKSCSYSVYMDFDLSSELSDTSSCTETTCMGSDGSNFNLSSKQFDKTISNSSCSMFSNGTESYSFNIKRSENNLYVDIRETERAMLELTNNDVSSATASMSDTQCDRVLSEISGSLDYLKEKFKLSFILTITEKDGEQCTESDPGK